MKRSRKTRPATCYQCGTLVNKDMARDPNAFFSDWDALRQHPLSAVTVQLGSVYYCGDCWALRSASNAAPDTHLTLGRQWDQLNQRSRWYTQQQWGIPSAFIALAAATTYTTVTSDLRSITAALGLAAVSALGLIVLVFSAYLRAGEKAAVYHMMRIELVPGFLRVTSMERDRHAGWLAPGYGILFRSVIWTIAVGAFVLALFFATVPNARSYFVPEASVKEQHLEDATQRNPMSSDVECPGQ